MYETHLCGRGHDLSSAGNRRNNSDRIRFLDGRFVLVQIADVLIVEIDIHKGAQLAVFREEMLAQAGMQGNKIAECLANGLGGYSYD